MKTTGAVQKTHFADDDTLKHIAKLEANNKELVEALRGFVSNEGDPMFMSPTPQQFENARKLLAKHGG